MNTPPNRPSQSNEGAPADPSLESSLADDFDDLSQGSDPGIMREFVDFLVNNKKWWLAPILVITLMLIGLAFLTASPAAPFIYSLF